MKKIAHLTSVHPPFDTRIFHKECKTLASAGYDVVLIAPHIRDEIVDGIKLRAVSKPRNRLMRIICTDWQVFILALRERAAVYHFHDPELIIPGLFLKLMTRAKIIYDVHEDNPGAIMERHWIPGPLRKGLSELFGFAEKLIARIFDALITADDVVAKHFKTNTTDIITLFNFPLSSLYENDIVKIPERFETMPLSLVYVGVMGRIRGLWLMLEAMEILLCEFGLDVKLTLAGDIFEERERHDFEVYVEHSNSLKERVVWLGRIPQAEVARVLAKADIGWVPLAPISKFHKNIPTKLFEYMASGLPVVGSDLPPIRRFVEAAQAGILAVPDSPRSHAEQILYLSQNPDLSRQMGENGRQAFRDQYNWESEALKLLKLYQGLVVVTY